MTGPQCQEYALCLLYVYWPLLHYLNSANGETTVLNCTALAGSCCGRQQAANFLGSKLPVLEQTHQALSSGDPHMHSMVVLVLTELVGLS